MRKGIWRLALALVAIGTTTAQAGNERARCGNGWGGGRWGNRLGNLEVVGLTADQRLVCFDEWRPGRAASIGAVSGLVTDTALVGIDFRPATGELFGLGNAGGIYALDVASGAATLRSRSSIAPSGSAFGVDFNPTVDRLRVVSDSGQNLRINVDTGAAIGDVDLNYTAGTPAAGIAGAAYTNNDADPGTATTLFDLDSAQDQISIQIPPNNGSLNPTGKLGLDASSQVGFDIYSDVRDQSAQRLRALASVDGPERSGLYKLNLLTGKLTPRGWFHPRDRMLGLAIPPAQRIRWR